MKIYFINNGIAYSDHIHTISFISDLFLDAVFSSDSNLSRYFSQLESEGYVLRIIKNNGDVEFFKQDQIQSIKSVVFDSKQNDLYIYKVYGHKKQLYFKNYNGFFKVLTKKEFNHEQSLIA